MRKIVCVICMIFCFTILFSGAVNATSCGIKLNADSDGRIGTTEASYALQVLSGVKGGQPNITLAKAVCALQTAVGMPTEYTEVTVKHFEGIWEGNGKFENDKWTGTVTLDLSAGDNGITGTITFEDIPSSDIAGAVENAEFSFYVPPSDPECAAEWDVTATATPDDSLKKLYLRTSGIFCGGESDSFSATLNKKE